MAVVEAGSLDERENFVQERVGARLRGAVDAERETRREKQAGAPGLGVGTHNRLVHVGDQAGDTSAQP